MRVLLVNPPSPEALGAPLLGQQYVAATLLRHGCDVRVVDAAARFSPFDADRVVTEVDAFAPHVVGFGLFTRWVLPAYRLAERLRGRVPWLVAGGAHATVRPREVLDRGFDVVVAGESEETLPRLVDRLEEGADLGTVAGVGFRASDGTIRFGPPARPPDVNALPSPTRARDLYDPRWYGTAEEPAPGGILTSRGCPARCTFCANVVTGRGLRCRRAADVVRELHDDHARTGGTFYAFWDDSFTASVRHVEALCRAFVDEVSFPFTWSAIMRADRVTRELLGMMRSAGCASVHFGAESGDDGILRAIKKGVSTRQVERSLAWAKDAGLTTVVSIMLGFAEDTPDTLANTRRFLERIAPLVDSFSTGGAVVPFPGTPIYEAHHDRHGFTDWWLREESGRLEPPPPPEDRRRYRRHYVGDANLDLDFFRYDDETRAMIGECMRYKAEHNLRHAFGWDEADVVGAPSVGVA